MPAGRPKEYTPERIGQLIKLMEEYTDQTDLPIFVEFCYKNKLVKSYLYELPELSDSIKKMMQKKEMNLEKGGLTNKLNPTMCIFSLKQMGWSDRKEITGSEGKPIEVKIDKRFDGI